LRKGILSERGMKMASETKEFLYFSITDIQGTIRAIDTKLIGVLVILILPLGSLGKVTLYISQATNSGHILIEILTWAFLAGFFVSWLISITISILGISSIENPTEFLSDSKYAPGTYYNGGLYDTFKFPDAFKVSDDCKSTILLNEQLSKLPTTIENVINELLFEQHKLVFIRDLKIHRQKTAFLFLAIFIGSGIVLWLVSFCLKEVVCR
jgi:hypothetical protein